MSTDARTSSLDLALAELEALAEHFSALVVDYQAGRPCQATRFQAPRLSRAAAQADQ